MWNNERAPTLNTYHKHFNGFLRRRHHRHGRARHAGRTRTGCRSTEVTMWILKVLNVPPQSPLTLLSGSFSLLSHHEILPRTSICTGCVGVGSGACGRSRQQREYSGSGDAENDLQK